jgi:glycosyltransferase involved in cell wall biosynthesis
MKIGFDVSQTGSDKAGCGYLAYSLAKALEGIDAQNEYILYPTFGDVYLDPDWARTTLDIKKTNFKRGLGHRSLETAQSFWRTPPGDFEAQLSNPDIIHSNNYFCPTGLKKARLVYTLHDLFYVSNPEWTTEANRIGCSSGVFNASIEADFIITTAKFTQHQFHATFPHYPVERTVVIPLASRFSLQSKLLQPRELMDLASGQFWLHVGTLEPRKNQARMLKAYAQLVARQPDALPLVLAGGKGWMMDEFGHLIADLGLSQHVKWLGYMEDPALQWLYQNCFAFLYPSLFEGFGMPVLEAMSLGAPVITSNVTSLPEVVGEAGLLVDPLDVESIYQAMHRLSEGEVKRSELQRKGFERSKLFSWEASARRVLSIYNHVMTLDKYSA